MLKVITIVIAIYLTEHAQCYDRYFHLATHLPPETRFLKAHKSKIANMYFFETALCHNISMCVATLYVPNIWHVCITFLEVLIEYRKLCCNSMS